MRSFKSWAQQCMCTCRLGDELLEVLGDVKSFEFPKFFNMGKVVEDLLTWGMMDLNNTSPKEASMKDVRAAYQHTNRKPKGLTQQVRLRYGAVHLVMLAQLTDVTCYGALFDSRHWDACVFISDMNAGMSCQLMSTSTGETVMMH